MNENERIVLLAVIALCSELGHLAIDAFRWYIKRKSGGTKDNRDN